MMDGHGLISSIVFVSSSWVGLFSTMKVLFLLGAAIHRRQSSLLGLLYGTLWAFQYLLLRNWLEAAGEEQMAVELEVSCEAFRVKSDLPVDGLNGLQAPICFCSFLAFSV